MPEECRPSVDEWQRMWAKIVAQAWADGDFKARLLADPAAVLREAGVEVPPGVSLQVHESTADTVYLVLPASPPAGGVEEGELRVSALSIAPPISCW